MSDSPLILALYAKTPAQYFSTVLGRAIGYSLLAQEEPQRTVIFTETQQLLTELGSDSLLRVHTITELISLMGFKFDIAQMNLPESAVMHLFWDAKTALESFWESDMVTLVGKLPAEQKKELLIRAFQDELSLVNGYRETMGYATLEGAHFLAEGQRHPRLEDNEWHRGKEQ